MLLSYKLAEQQHISLQKSSRKRGDKKDIKDLPAYAYVHNKRKAV